MILHFQMMPYNKLHNKINKCSKMEIIMNINKMSKISKIIKNKCNINSMNSKIKFWIKSINIYHNGEINEKKKEFFSFLRSILINLIVLKNI